MPYRYELDVLPPDVDTVSVTAIALPARATRHIQSSRTRTILLSVLQKGPNLSVRNAISLE